MLAFKSKGVFFMKSLLVFSVLFPFFAQAKILASYTYLKAKKPIQKSIDITELRSAYNLVKASTFNPPAPEDFFNDFLRFKIGVEVALNETSLVENPAIDQQINDPYLRKAFHQELYKALAEQKLKAKTQNLDRQASKLSERTLKTLYSQEPEFNIFFITIFHAINPTPSQIQKAKKRAGQIYSQVIQSKKPFVELVALYSDDKSNGLLNINRSKASIFPAVYSQLKKMKEQSISKPIRVPSGFVIVKLNRKIPFNEANTTAIKANYFNRKRTDLFNSYFNSLRSQFKVRFVNRELIKTL